jgi:hypothetical protein
VSERLDMNSLIRAAAGRQRVASEPEPVEPERVGSIGIGKGGTAGPGPKRSPADEFNRTLHEAWLSRRLHAGLDDLLNL